MRARTLLVLFVLVVGLGAFVWFYERDLPSSAERAEQARKVLGGLASDRVDAVTIEWGQRRVRLEREAAEPAEGDEEIIAAGGWRLAEPFTARADAARVDRLLDDLAALEKQQTVAEPDHAELGLDPPRATVTLTGDGVDTVLTVGAELPASDSMVVAVAGRPEAHAVADAVWEELTQDPGEWRDKLLFSGERADIRSIRLTSAAGEAVLLVRRGDDFWLEAPLSDRADRGQTDRLLGDLTGLAASRFIDDEPAAGTPPDALGLEPPAGRIEVVLAGSEAPWRIEIGAPVGDGESARYARVGGQRLEITTDLAAWLATPAAAWRSPAVTAFDSWEVDRLRLADAGGETLVERDGLDWRRDGDKVPFIAVSDLLSALTELVAERVVDPAAAPAPVAEPLLRATLASEEGSEEILVIDPPAEGLAAARPAGRDAVLLLGASAVDEVLARLAELRAAEPLPEEEAAGADAGGLDDLEVTVEEGDE